MNNSLINELEASLTTGFIDYTKDSMESFRPKLLVNNYKKGTKVLSYLIDELKTCNEFYFSIAFVTNSGLNLLLNIFKELEEKGIKGKLITSDYLNFNDPKALRRLLKFKNIEVKIYDNGNFHSKGYIFKHKDNSTLIVGSSNLTQEALTKNEEWNLKITSMENGELLRKVEEEFCEVWNKATNLTDEWINNYEKIYNKTKHFSLENISEILNFKKITPNKMQEAALDNLQKSRDKGETKALLISATGTGKTYLSAFDVEKFNPKKMLFVVHREQIARSAMESFKKIFKDSKKMGILSGTSRKINDCDFVFSTMQTLSKNNILNSFKNDYFDYIVIDEVHRAGAASYLKILDYFRPKFLLGMTATPERMDNFNIYELFDYNIAYEIRLQQALEEDMLCPFHYFGVSEIKVNGKILDDNANFNNLISTERINNIISNIEFYGYSGNRVKGLVFCSKNEEAEELSKEFNKRGYSTLALSGKNTQEERENAIERLTQKSSDNKLDYIFTVDIFNEGVDIPDVNQIVMLRPTESAIIFVQQLGRGLRKAKYKDYVVVIDFIGNYQKNFLIPIALSGDRTYNKDTIRKYVAEGTNVIPGCSTIMFDRISQKKIYDSINKSNFSTLKLLKDKYYELKNKVGHIPNLNDFYNYASIDPELIFKYSKSYYNFLIKIDEKIGFTLNNNQIKALEMFSNEISNGKRPHELLILNDLLENNYTTFEQIEYELEKYNIKNDNDSINSAIDVLNGVFFTSSKGTKKYDYLNFLKIENDVIKRNDFFNSILDDNFKEILKDLIEYSLHIYEDNYISHYLDTNLTLYKKYSRKDVCRLLNWKNDDSSTIYGYKIKYNTLPIFVTYRKKSNISESTKYDDKFIDNDTFSWLTRSRINLDSKEVIEIQNYKETNLKIHLFVKKEDAEGTDFYYLGEMEPKTFELSSQKDNEGNDLSIVNIKYKMKTSVRNDVYDYITK